MRRPCFAAAEIPTTLAEAPIGVALPPMSVPMDKAHASTGRLAFWVTDSFWMTGIMAAAKGMLSTNALATADSHMMIPTITFTCPPLILLIKPAITARIPVFSNPLTTINKPIKNKSVLQSIFSNISGICFVDAARVAAAAAVPIDATVSPVCAWVINSTTVQRKIRQLTRKPVLSVIASLGAGYFAAGSGGFESAESSFRKQR